jgi:sigma-B regulation protein RsbU (phosphoserine phosphatase)
MKENDQDQRIQELLLLQRVSNKINSILNLDTLLEEIVGDVAETFGYTRSGVLLKDNETNELEIAAVRGWTVNYHMKGERFKIGEYGIVGNVAVTGETHYAPDVTLDPYYKVSEESTRSELDIPLKKKEELIGVFNVQHQEPNAFTPERIKLLESLAHHIEIAIENARLFQKERLEKERMLNELKDAHNIQTNLFPKEFPVVPGFNLTGICLPCLEVGGDWYDFINLPKGRLGIVLADVSGKGMGAALLMSSTRSLLRLIANAGHSPGIVLKQINEILIKDFPSTRFVTMIYALFDPKEQSLVFANAGHLNPLFINLSDNLHAGQVSFIETSEGLPLGIAESEFTEYKINFTPGSKLVFYTDGVTEAMNSAEEEYGSNRLIELLSNSSTSIQNIVEDVQSFVKGVPQSDDVTVVMVEANKN